MAETITIQIVVDAKTKKEIKALAKAEGRSQSNMASWLLTLGKLKYYEKDSSKAQKEVAA